MKKILWFLPFFIMSAAYAQYAVYSFLKTPANLIVTRESITWGVGTKVGLKGYEGAWSQFDSYAVNNIQPKTVHEWHQNAPENVWPVVIMVRNSADNKELRTSYARKFDESKAFSSWSIGEPCRNFVHFVITPAGEILKVAQLFNDGSIILSAGPEVGMGYKIWPDRHVTMGPKPDLNNCAQTYLPEEKNSVQMPAGQFPIIVNDGNGNGKLAWSTENWWQ